MAYIYIYFFFKEYVENDKYGSLEKTLVFLKSIFRVVCALSRVELYTMMSNSSPGIYLSYPYMTCIYFVFILLLLSSSLFHWCHMLPVSVSNTGAPSHGIDSPWSHRHSRDGQPHSHFSSSFLLFQIQRRISFPRRTNSRRLFSPFPRKEAVKKRTEGRQS